MSIKALVEGIETARINNQTLGANVGGKFAELSKQVNTAGYQMSGQIADLVQQIEQARDAFLKEIEERDRDLVRLMEGAA